MNQRHFRGNPDYKAAFSVAVTDLIASNRANPIPRAERMRLIGALIDEYVASTGERPDGAELDRLADAALYEELTDQRRNKMTATEYPFMSEWQLAVRRNREYGLHLAEERGSDGRDHRPPKRRKRTERELRAIDMYTRSRNAERRRQYRKDTAPGELITYSIRELATT
jgi:hypothetical protein